MNTSLAFKLTVFVLLAAAAILASPFIKGRVHPPYTRINLECEAISQAVKAFEIDFGKLPDGASAEVFQALSGANQKRICFLNASRTNTSGEAVDLWGTPYQISFTTGANIVITSAGKNCKFGDADDYVYNGRQSQFTQKPN